MDKIKPQTLELDAVQEPIHKPAEGFFVDVWNIQVSVRMNGLTSVGYDDEIGLWEELEHRRALDKALPG